MNRIIALLILALVWGSATVSAQPGDLVPQALNQHALVASDPSFMPPGGLTVECWIYYDPVNSPWGATYPTMVRNSNINHPYIFRVNNMNGKLQFGVATNVGNYTGFDSTVNVPFQTWVHVAATWDGATMRIYLDGQVVGQKPKIGTMSMNTQDIYLGGGPTGMETWLGRIDELRIWDHARSQNQIIAAMHAKLDGSPGLIAAWHFDGDFLDLTGGHDAQPQNGLMTLPSTSPISTLSVVVPQYAPIGQTLTFQLKGAPPFSPYFFDNSFDGYANGIPLIAPLIGVFPLDPPLLNLQYGAAAPGVFVDYMGITDANGEAVASFAVPDWDILIGLELSSAWLYLTSLQPMVLGETSPIGTTILQGTAPTISAVMPAQSPLAGNWPIAITGQNFRPGAVARFGGRLASNHVVHSPTLLSCRTPAGLATGPVVVEVENLDDTTAIAPAAFNYVPDLLLSQVSPLFASPGDQVTLSGGGFLGSTTLSVGGQATPIDSGNPTQLQFTMPAVSGCHLAVVVANPDGQSAGLLMNPGPFVATVIGNSGPWFGGTTFEIYGNGFSSQAQVTVDGAAATVLVAASTYLKVVSPPGIVGPALVEIINPDGCTATTSFYYGY